eukprot:10642380-Alexandrium_andersonii.AAC.1
MGCILRHLSRRSRICQRKRGVRRGPEAANSRSRELQIRRPPILNRRNPWVSASRGPEYAKSL